MSVVCVCIVAKRSYWPSAKDPAHHWLVAWWRQITVLRHSTPAAASPASHPPSQRTSHASTDFFRFFHDFPLPGHSRPGPHRGRWRPIHWAVGHGEAEVDDDAAAGW